MTKTHSLKKYLYSAVALSAIMGFAGTISADHHKKEGETSCVHLNNYSMFQLDVAGHLWLPKNRGC